VTILRFSGEGTKNSHMAGGMELLATWSHVMEMSTFVGVILVVRISLSEIVNLLTWLIIAKVVASTSAVDSHEHACMPAKSKEHYYKTISWSQTHFTHSLQKAKWSIKICNICLTITLLEGCTLCISTK